jgi:universal stress protein F
MYKHILLPVDLEKNQLLDRAIAMAEDLAGHYGARLSALTVIPDFNSSLVASFFPDDAMTKAHREIQGELRTFINGHFRSPDTVHAHVAEGTTRKAIVDFVKCNAVDLIVIPARKRDLSKLLLGSNCDYVVDHAPCTVIVVKPG